MGALDRRSIQSQSRISCALCAVARKRESPALDPAFCRPNAQVTHGGADGGAGHIRQKLSLLVVLSASPPTTIQQSQSQHLQSKEAPSKPFPPNQTTTTIKMGGCGNSNCSCSSCSCAPGSCTCGK